MNHDLPDPPGFWRTVRLLLSAALYRAKGRRMRQRELFQHRTKGNSLNWDALGTILTALLMIGVNVGAAFLVRQAVAAAGRIDIERRGKIVVSRSFLKEVKARESIAPATSPTMDKLLGSPEDYYYEAKRLAEEYGGSQAVFEEKLRSSVRNHGSRDLIAYHDSSFSLTSLPAMGPLSTMLGSLVFLWWLAMIVFQGEGLELDLQRRRHPMWEWVFSHPVSPRAVFFAEMLSPIAANPAYWSAPLFAGSLFTFVYGGQIFFPATVLIGIPVTIAAACLGKALEIAVILRFPMRSRGAIIGLMGWMGYSSMFLLLVSLFAISKIVTAISKYLIFFSTLPWPWLKLVLGARPDGSFSFATGVLVCWIFAGIMSGGAVWFSVWGAQKGLSGNAGRADTRPSVSVKQRPRFGKDPLYRKELLWFVRDRSAIVQTILVPLTVASYQIFNLRSILVHANGAWNYLCGAAILFGTYFLWILGPKSLLSEGTALWIALTWPRGLENLLKAKAWLWSLISTGIVALVLSYACYLFPANIWQIALVGIGWFLFGTSMAEKSVTLVTVASSSGEPEKPSRGRQWAAQLGMLTFAIGILTQQWHLAIVGIVYSWITAAAMWENFRARLPFLYDPWSETLPPPPTLMHAMIAISILVEVGAIFTGIMVASSGRENIAIAQAVGYAFCAVGVSIGAASFLNGRGVSLGEVWRWSTAMPSQETAQSWWNRKASSGASLRVLGTGAIGATGGLILGLFAHGYVAILRYIPEVAEILRKSQEQMAKIPNLRVSYAVMAVGFAPFAEEYLFRGLLFRALDREWGGWRALVGSAAFFAVYHPPLSWLPVGLLGLTNAFIFKKTGYLFPAVILHMVYNAVVLYGS